MKYYILSFVLLFLICGACKEKNILNNQNPGSFTVTAKLNTYERAIMLDWTAAIDPDGDIVNYSVEVEADTITDKLSVMNFSLKNFKYHTTIKGTVTAHDGKGGKTQAPFSISIENINLIEDSNFEQFLIDIYIDKDQELNGVVDVDDIKRVEVLGLNGKKIKSLKGIEIFTNLQSLDCSFNQIRELDLSKNEKLSYILAHENELEKIEFGNKEALEFITIERNKLSKLDVSNIPNLKSLSCEGNRLTELNLTKNKQLVYLSCGNEKLATLDVSNNIDLERLYCGGHRELKEIKIPKANKIQYLHFLNSSITNFEFNECPELIELDCSSTKLTSLNIEKCTKLQKIQCGQTDLKSLNLKTNTLLKTLYCVSIGLESLDLSNNRQLTDLVCDRNQLRILDIRYNTSLNYLDCSLNKIGIICVADLSKVKDNWRKDSNADYFVCD